MIVMLLGIALFFAIHAVRMVAPGYREARIASMGERTWKGIYSLVSFAGLGLMIWGWMLFRAEAPEVFTPPAWGRYANLALMLLAFILVVSAELPAGRISQAIAHPMITGVLMWALGHLLANGDLASVLLFGSFLIYTLINRIVVASRPSAPEVTPAIRSDVLAVLIGGGAYAIFGLYIHGWLFGISPF